MKTVDMIRSLHPILSVLTLLVASSYAPAGDPTYRIGSGSETKEFQAAADEMEWTVRVTGPLSSYEAELLLLQTLGYDRPDSFDDCMLVVICIGGGGAEFPAR